MAKDSTAEKQIKENSLVSIQLTIRNFTLFALILAPCASFAWPCRYSTIGDAKTGYQTQINVTYFPGVGDYYNCKKDDAGKFDCIKQIQIIGSGKMPADTLVQNENGIYSFKGVQCGAFPSYGPPEPAPIVKLEKSTIALLKKGYTNAAREIEEIGRADAMLPEVVGIEDLASTLRDKFDLGWNESKTLAALIINARPATEKSDRSPGRPTTAKAIH